MKRIRLSVAGGFASGSMKKEWHHEKQKTSLCPEAYSAGAQGQ